MFAFGLKEGMIIGRWGNYGLEKCTTLEERNRVNTWGKKEYLYIKDKY